jgi:serine/threonine protein kinase
MIIVVIPAPQTLTVHDCPFIARMFGSFTDDDNVYFVMQFCPGGELYSYIQVCFRVFRDADSSSALDSKHSISYQINFIRLEGVSSHCGNIGKRSHMCVCVRVLTSRRWLAHCEM